MHVSQKTLMCLQPKTWNLIGKPPYRSLTFIQECSFQWKSSFFVVGQHWCKVTFFQNLLAQIRIIKVILAKWNGKLIEVSYLLKNFVRIAIHSEDRVWNMTTSTRKSKFHPCAVFSTKALQRDGRYAKRKLRAV